MSAAGEGPIATPSADGPEVVARVKEGLPLVRIIARRLRGQLGGRLSADDLESAGQEALLRAARSFDPARGVPFLRWVNLRVRGAMIDAARSSSEVSRRMYKKIRAIEAADRVQDHFLAEGSGAQGAAGASAATATTAGATAAGAAGAGAAGAGDAAVRADAALTDFLGQAAAAMAIGMLSKTPLDEAFDAKSEDESPFDAAARGELRATMLRAIASRPEQERHLLQRHYFDGLDFDEAAAEIGLSKSWASRLHARAIKALGESLGARDPATSEL